MSGLLLSFRPVTVPSPKASRGQRSRPNPLNLIRSPMLSSIPKDAPPNGHATVQRCLSLRNNWTSKRSDDIRPYSLLPADNSLFSELFSLIIRVGKCLKKRLRPGDLRLRNRLCQPKTAVFPEKFPVCREFGPETGANSTASPANQSGAWRFTLSNLRNARQWRAFVNW